MQQRRGTAEQWTLANPVLAAGEIGFETNTNNFKIGNGVNNWETLPYFASSTEPPAPATSLTPHPFVMIG
jgi:hypothetical protein